jgi:hypothetical protein
MKILKLNMFSLASGHDPLIYTSHVAGITGVNHQDQYVFEMGSH